MLVAIACIRRLANLALEFDFCLWFFNFELFYGEKVHYWPFSISLPKSFHSTFIPSFWSWSLRFFLSRMGWLGALQGLVLPALACLSHFLSIFCNLHVRFVPRVLAVERRRYQSMCNNRSRDFFLGEFACHVWECVVLLSRSLQCIAAAASVSIRKKIEFWLILIFTQKKWTRQFSLHWT